MSDAPGQRGRLRSAARPAIIAVLAAAAEALPPLTRRLREGLTIFAFHDVTPTPSPYEERFLLATSVELFRAQVRWIVERYQVVHPDLLLQDDPELPARAAMLTFDDGWAGTFDHAFPVLEQLGLPSLTFVNMSTVAGMADVAALVAYLADDGHGPGTGAAHPPWPGPASFADRDLDAPADEGIAAYQGDFATPERLRRWDGHPLVRYGNHLHRHWDSSALDDEQFAEAFGRNVAALDVYESTLPFFAFPFGRPGEHFTERQVHLTLELGAQRVFSGLPERNLPPYAPYLHRVSFTPADMTPAQRWYSTHHRWLRRALRIDR